MAVSIQKMTCPTCNAEEMHPDGDKLLIRGFKYMDTSGYWWSQCLVCSGGYNNNLVFNETKHNPQKGWF